MGVKGLGKVCAAAPGSVEDLTDGERFRGKVLALDTSGLMHKFVYTCESIDDNDHLKNFLVFHRHLLEGGATGLFVFDGKQTAAKLDENIKRSKVKEKTKQKLEGSIAASTKEFAEVQARLEEQPPGAADNMEDVVRMSMLRGQLWHDADKSKRVVKQDYYRQLQELFTQERIPFVVARYEAEQACAWLVVHGYADYVVSEDYDTILSRADCMVQRFHAGTMTGRIIYRQPLLDHLKMTHEQFVDYCILLGTDFGGKLKGLGPSRAATVICKYGTIERFLASKEGKKYRKPAGEEFNYDVPRIMFLDTTFPLIAHGLSQDADGLLGKLLVAMVTELQNNPIPVERFPLTAPVLPAVPYVDPDASESASEECTKKVRRRIVHI